MTLKRIIPVILIHANMHPRDVCSSAIDFSSSNLLCMMEIVTQEYCMAVALMNVFPVYPRVNSMGYQCLTGPLFHAVRTRQTWMTKWVPKNNGSHINMSILTTCPICDKVIFMRAEIMGRTQCCQRVTHITCFQKVIKEQLLSGVFHEKLYCPWCFSLCQLSPIMSELL